MNGKKLINLSLSLAFAMALVIPISANCADMLIIEDDGLSPVFVVDDTGAFKERPRAPDDGTGTSV